MQFFVAGVLSVPVALIFEHPTPAGIGASWIPLMYAGVMSCGVANTLQIFGQRGTPPAIASLIMSLESVFAAISGALILKEKMTANELVGCALMFFAIILSQVIPMIFYRIYHRRPDEDEDEDEKKESCESVKESK